MELIIGAEVLLWPAGEDVGIDPVLGSLLVGLVATRVETVGLLQAGYLQTMDETLLTVALSAWASKGQNRYLFIVRYLCRVIGCDKDIR